MQTLLKWCAVYGLSILACACAVNPFKKYADEFAAASNQQIPIIIYRTSFSSYRYAGINEIEVDFANLSKHTVDNLDLKVKYCGFGADVDNLSVKGPFLPNSDNSSFPSFPAHASSFVSQENAEVFARHATNLLIISVHIRFHDGTEKDYDAGQVLARDVDNRCPERMPPVTLE